MFFFKTAVLGLVFLISIIQLVSIGANLLDGIGKRKTDFMPTSFVQGSVVEVALPTPEELKVRSIPGYSGKVIIEYRDQTGSVQRKEFMRTNSKGPTEVYDKKVGDEFKIEIPNPANGGASTPEKNFWANISKLLFLFAGVLTVAAVVFRFL